VSLPLHAEAQQSCAHSTTPGSGGCRASDIEYVVYPRRWYGVPLIAWTHIVGSLVPYLLYITFLESALCNTTVIPVGHDVYATRIRGGSTRHYRGVSHLNFLDAIISGTPQIQRCVAWPMRIEYGV